jgi:hypothetical protein
MRVKAWSNGRGVYGIRVGAQNRAKFFDASWAEIEVELESEVHRFRLTDGFWRDCPEFRDRGAPILREWLRTHRTLNWPKGDPPAIELIPLAGNRFRLAN